MSRSCTCCASESLATRPDERAVSSAVSGVASSCPAPVLDVGASKSEVVFSSAPGVLGSSVSVSSLPGGFPFTPFWFGSRLKRHYIPRCQTGSQQYKRVDLTYIATISLHFQIVCEGEKVDIGFRQDLEVAGPLRKVGDELDRLGPGISELEKGRPCGLKPGSCSLIAN